MNKKVLQSGLTLIELLIVVAIVGVIMVAMVFLIRNQLSRGRDAQRKTDLEAIKVAFENYYNDNNCYPPANVLESCQSSNLQPYLNEVPCDPITQDPYLYVPLAGNACAGYRLYATIDSPDDPNVEKLGCDGADGCNVGTGFERYNYGVSAGVSVVSDGSYSGGNGGGAQGGTHACSPGQSGISTGICNVYADPDAAGCPIDFASADCNNACNVEANWCAH